MIQVHVDGNTVQTDAGQIRTMGELIEYVKSTIDPDTMITSISFSGENLSETDWNLPLTQHRDRTLEVTTGTKHRYLADRLGSAEDILAEVIQGFRLTADSYRMGFQNEGNQRISRATEDLLAYINWLSALLALDNDRFELLQHEFASHVDAVREISEQLLQQQLYSSWWALGEMIATKLIPALETLKAFAGRVAAASRV